MYTESFAAPGTLAPVARRPARELERIEAPTFDAIIEALRTHDLLDQYPMRVTSDGRRAVRYLKPYENLAGKLHTVWLEEDTAERTDMVSRCATTDEELNREDISTFHAAALMDISIEMELGSREVAQWLAELRAKRQPSTV